MNNGWIKCAAVSPEIRVADCAFNADGIISSLKSLAEKGVKVVVTPELALTGATCGDLFFQSALLGRAKKELFRIAKETSSCDTLFFVGMPLRKGGAVFNVACALCKGEILGFVPGGNVHSDRLNADVFAEGPADGVINIDGKDYPFGTDILFRHKSYPDFCVGAVIGEDADNPFSQGADLVASGAFILAHLSASAEISGAADLRRAKLKEYSRRNLCAVVTAYAGKGESTSSAVYAGHDLITEAGEILTENAPFENKPVVSDVDTQYLAFRRSRFYGFPQGEGTVIPFDLKITESALDRIYDASPFLSKKDVDAFCESLLRIQAEALVKRIEHTRSQKLVIGVSGGLDSCLSLIVAARSKKLLNRSLEIVGVTMPCFGTTGRTYKNACRLVKLLGATLKEINIKESVEKHFADIGHDGTPDTAFENAQARERTQVLMDYANMCNGLVIGTGDLSELALGWATFNGDHMSMYGTNGSVPKTLIRVLVGYEAKMYGEELAEVLSDILATPVSPELLPSDDNAIAQKTEDIVGPYELHDFFLYYAVNYGYSPKKILTVAEKSFEGVYNKDIIKAWLKKFFSRFFAQQFKRSCLPDGPSVTSVNISSAGWKMPSDACGASWTDELN